MMTVQANLNYVQDTNSDFTHLHTVPHALYVSREALQDVEIEPIWKMLARAADTGHSH